MQSAFRRRCTASMRAENEENGSIFVSVTRIGLVAAQCESALLAPHTYSGMMKVSVFEDWFKKTLLKKLPKKHVILMDNAAFHKKEVLHNLAEKCSRTLSFCRSIRLNTILLSTSRGALKQNITGCVHLYDSISQALNAILEGY